MWKKLFLFALIMFFLAALLGAGLATWGYYYITRDLPKIGSINEYRPKAASFVYSNDGTQVAEFYEERRYPVKLSEIPQTVRNAFLAAEDASFYSHPGIDFMSILRAVVKNVRTGSARQGGSTITQQVVKNLLLNREKTLTRKAKEAILSYQLERRLTKDEILEIYLNQIFFGNFAYGVKAAAKLYFHKELNQLTVAEAAILAGLPAAPSGYSPILHMDLAKKRQRYVLEQMVHASFITAEARDAAEREEIKVYPATAQNFYRAPYYISDVRRILTEEWKDLSIDTDGLQIYTALDLDADRMATAALRKGLREVDKRRGWRGPLKSYARDEEKNYEKDFANAIDQELEFNQVYPALVREVSASRGTADVTFGGYRATVNLKGASWAKRRLDHEDNIKWIEPEQTVRAGDVIEVSIQAPDSSKKENAKSSTTAEKEVSEEPDAALEKSLKKPEISSDGVVQRVILDQTPDIEAALVFSDPHSGKVLTMVGGYSYQRSQYNRASQALRQPGSSFKPVVYLAAIDKFHYTPATIVQDTPRTFRVGDEFWTPGNFDGKYMGNITLRTALEKSRNLVSADIISKIGVDAAISYARLLGILSPLGRNLSLALGSSEMTLLELARAYSVFPARGVLFPTVLITRIVDREGNVIFDYENEKLNKAKQVISENSAFIMANLMKGVVEHGTGYKVKALGRPAAGKTGTSNDQMDAWFIGYTPDWVCGVWAGFDQKKEIGEKETGGMVSAPIWLYFMKEYLDAQDAKNRKRQIEEAKSEAQRLGIDYVPPEPLEPLDFAVPDGVDPFWVDKETGVLSSPEAPGAIYEYFIKGTEPSKGSAAGETSNSYLQSPDL